MAETTNYKLFLTDDKYMYFLNWREKISGQDDSNMVIIDRVLGEKAQHSICVNTTLTASGWSEVHPYTQSLSIENLTAEQNGILSAGLNINDEQLENIVAAEMRITKQEEGSVTVTAYGDKPMCDIPVMIILLD